VTIDGRNGKYLVWSAPADWVVTGDADFQGCDDPGNGHHDYVSWLGEGHGERYMIVAGQVEQIWVIDVNGQALVVSATYAPNVPGADRAELAAVAASLRFDAPR
jgi:hypothetical protein